jgi:hypothetical protein
VAAVEHVVLALAAAGEPAHALELAERGEAFESAGQELVRVGLVSGVPDDAVDGAFEEPMERHRELDHAEGAPQVAAGAGDGLDDRRADLGAELCQLLAVERAQRAGTVE